MRTILILSDEVYSIPSSKVSLVNLIRHNCNHLESKVNFKNISSRSTDTLVKDTTNRILELSLYTKKDKGIAYILCGLEECIGGFNVPIYNTLLSTLAYELDRINYDVVFIKSNIDHGLPGKIGGWFKRSGNIISECCEKYFCEHIRPDVILKIIGNEVSLPIESSRNIVKSICEDIESKLEVYNEV